MRYYLYSAKNSGPFTKEELSGLNLSCQDLVKEEGTDYWIEADKLSDLQDLFTPAPKAEFVEPEIEVAVEEATGVEEGVHEAAEGQESEERAEAESEEAPEETATAEEEAQTPVVSPVPSVQPKPRTPLLVAICVLAVVLLFLGFNPGKKAHEPYVVKMVENTMELDHQMNSNPFFDFFNDLMFDMFFGGSGRQRQKAKQILNDIEYSNAYLFSFTSVKNGGSTKWLTLGVLGHVFVLNQKALDEHVLGPSATEEIQPEEKPQKEQAPKKRKPTPTPDDAVTL